MGPPRSQRAGPGRCNCVIARRSPASNTLPRRPGVRQGLISARSMAGAPVDLRVTVPIRGLSRRGCEWLGGTALKPRQRSACCRTAFPRVCRAAWTKRSRRGGGGNDGRGVGCPSAARRRGRSARCAAMAAPPPRRCARGGTGPDHGDADAAGHGARGAGHSLLAGYRPCLGRSTRNRRRPPARSFSTARILPLAPTGATKRHASPTRNGA